MKSILLILLLPLTTLLSFPQKTPKSVSLKPVYQNGHWGYADATGRIAIEPRFDAALPFAAGLARVGVVDEDLPEIDGRPNLLWGYIDETGRAVVALHYNELRGFNEGLAAVAVIDPALPDTSVVRRLGRSNQRWGFVDREGRAVIATQFFGAGDFAEGLAAVDVGGERNGSCGRNQHYGYIDKAGIFVIKPRFAGAGPFQNGHARVSIGHTEFNGRCLCCAPRFVGQYGSIDRSGVFVVEGKSKGGDSILEPEQREMRK
jgi:hypothetical protein